ncbi:MAG: hypothetical protein GY850_27500 [bacterium]|nr:hypothetical protein [bacterium]
MKSKFFYRLLSKTGQSTIKGPIELFLLADQGGKVDRFNTPETALMERTHFSLDPHPRKSRDNKY